MREHLPCQCLRIVTRRIRHPVSTVTSQARGEQCTSRRLLRYLSFDDTCLGLGK